MTCNSDKQVNFFMYLFHGIVGASNDQEMINYYTVHALIVLTQGLLTAIICVFIAGLLLVNHLL